MILSSILDRNIRQMQLLHIVLVEVPEVLFLGTPTGVLLNWCQGPSTMTPSRTRPVFFFLRLTQNYFIFLRCRKSERKKNRHRQKNWREFQKNPLKFDQKLKEIRENKCNFVFCSPAAADYRGKSYY